MENNNSKPLDKDLGLVNPKDRRRAHVQALIRLQDSRFYSAGLRGHEREQPIFLVYGVKFNTRLDICVKNACFLQQKILNRFWSLFFCPPLTRVLRVGNSKRSFIGRNVNSVQCFGMGFSETRNVTSDFRVPADVFECFAQQTYQHRC